MKKKILTAVVGCFVLLSSSAVNAESGLYTSLHLGMTVPEDTDASWSGVSLAEVSAENSYSMIGALGYDFGGFRLETELGYQDNSIDGASVAGLSMPAGGDVTMYSGLINLYVDFENRSRVTPYITAGMGMAHVAVNDFSTVGVSSSSEYTDTVFLGQVGAGLEMAVTDKVGLDLRYRYVMTEEAELGYLNSEISSHNVYAGMRFQF